MEGSSGTATTVIQTFNQLIIKGKVRLCLALFLSLTNISNNETIALLLTSKYKSAVNHYPRTIC